MIEYNAAKRPSGLRACADGLDVNPDKDFAQKCMMYAADKMEELEQQRDRLAEAVNAATILIAAKGRHNTMLAYNGLRDALQSLTTNAETIYGEKDSD
jgi:hypothetical protein